MKLSVIVPALNEETCLPTTLSRLRAQRPDELIVVDGGSQDATRSIARANATLLDGPRGRAAQMNFGAGRARGDLLLFLHADCWLEEGALERVCWQLSRRRVVAGCFRMRVDAPGLLFRCIDRAATARVKFTGLIYGDQGLYVRRSTFEAIGGFPPLRLMEDVFISRTLRRLGRVVVDRSRIFVSPRRWRQQGLVRQSLRNWTLTALAAGGVHPDRLAAFYPLVR